MVGGIHKYLKLVLSDRITIFRWGPVAVVKSGAIFSSSKQNLYHGISIIEPRKVSFLE